ncbi:MAG: PASTA domain-containing protein, partial [Bdellovibrionales bacterium]|nr:PASTA domain-containing protein [Bdellovibrionales bacterium]
LAGSLTTYSLFADPSLIQFPRKVAKKIARKLGIKERSVWEKIRRKDRRFTWIERHLSKEVSDEISGWKVRGLSFIREFKRIYPNEELASPVIGRVSSDGKGIEGVEGFYEAQLGGEEQNVRILRDAKGRPLLGDSSYLFEQPHGRDVYLTLDKDLQYELEQQISNAIVKHEAQSGVGIILDVKTSEILGMATLEANSNPEFPPKSSRRNWGAIGAFEPGSTFKAITIAAALNEGLVHPNTPIDCEGGSLKIGKYIVGEADEKHKYKELTVSEVLSKSSNVGTTKIGFMMGEKTLRRYIKLFGFGAKTGLDFWGESKGIVRESKWGKIELSNISFGQGISVTPLQIANAYAAIANGGELRTPFLVKSIRDVSQGTNEESHGRSLGRVISEDTAKKMRLMLTAATGEEGTGLVARVPGYLVAGKTGTAQKVNPNGRGYLPGGYISSFAGFFPAEEPTHVIYIAIDSPKKGYYGAEIAAPVFSRLASHILRAQRVRPVVISQKQMLEESSATQVELEKRQIQTIDRVPNLKGLTLKQVMNEIHGSGIEVSVVGSGYVKVLFPAPGEPIPENKRIQVVLGTPE